MLFWGIQGVVCDAYELMYMAMFAIPMVGAVALRRWLPG